MTNLLISIRDAILASGRADRVKPRGNAPAPLARKPSATLIGSFGAN